MIKILMNQKPGLIEEFILLLAMKQRSKCLHQGFSSLEPKAHKVSL